MTAWQRLRRWQQQRNERREGRLLLREGRRVARRYGHRLTTAQRGELAERNQALAQAIAERGDVAATRSTLQSLLDDELVFTRKSTARQYVELVGGVVFVAILLRSLVVEAYRIPSGSMLPTLQVGDRIWVNKLVYGVDIPFTHVKLAMHYRTPRRGEIIVFDAPRDDKTLIKRVVAVAGDKVEVRDEVVYVNDRPVARRALGKTRVHDFDEVNDTWSESDDEAWQETMGAATFTTLHDTVVGGRNQAPTIVPPDSLFVMGDNRDNSSDSRYWGFVPLDLVRGQAMFVWWSFGEPEGFRTARVGHVLR